MSKYLDVGGIATIGYGHVCGSLQRDVTQGEAENILLLDIGKIDGAICWDRLRGLNCNQCAAVTVLAFNIGARAFNTSKLCGFIEHWLIVAGMYEGEEHADYINEWREKIKAEWDKWHFVKKLPVAGLVTRREAEQKLFWG